MRFHKKIKRHITTVKRCFDWFNSKKHQKSIFRLGSQIIFSLIIVAQFTGTSAALAVNTNNMDNAQSSGGYLQEKTITWGDGSIEDLRLNTDGYFSLNGVKQRLVGFHFGVPTPAYDEEWNPNATGSKTQFWTTENLAFLDNMLSYLQSKGVRIIRIPLVYTYLSSTTDEANAYKALLDLTAKHKMYVVGWLVCKWFPGFNCIQPTSNFVIPGGTNGDTLDTWLNRLVPIVAQYPNLIVMNCENELDGPYEFSSTTTSGGNVGGTTMIDGSNFGTGASNRNPTGWTITITSGACSGQSSKGLSVAGTTVTLASAFTAQIASGVTYTAIQNYSVADAVAHFTYLKNKFKTSIPNIMITHNFCDDDISAIPLTKALLPLLDFPSFDIYALNSGQVNTLISTIKSTYGINNFWMEEIGQASQSVPYVDNTAFSSSFIDNAFTDGATIAVMYCALHDYWTNMSFFNPSGTPLANTDSLLSNNMAAWQTAIPSGAPVVTNDTGASNLTTTTATLNGNLISDGGASTSVTVYWGTTDGGTTAASWSGNVAVGTQSVGAFTANITGLTASTTYYYRCYASNSAGSAWAPTSVSFTTSAPAPVTPTVTNSTGASNITTTAATLNGNLTSDGGAASTVSVYWGTTDGGTTVASWSGNVAVGTQSVGAFTANITGLTASTTYYYRCYASNSAGSAWAPTSVSFTTSAPAPVTPTVTNSTGASNITTTTATLNGNLTSDGGAASTVSIYWGTTDGGTTLSAWDGNVTVSTKSVGAFTANLTGLTASTTYYYRCYATNSAGSAWAPTSASFTTSAPAPPPVTAPTIPTVTNATGASNIAATTAILNGNLTSDGGAASTVTVYWGTKDGGTTTASWSGNVAVGTQSVGAFTDNLTGLTASTTYYYRCYASNSAGSAWAPTSASFTTSAPAPVTPTVTNSTGASNITTTAATLNGNLTSDGGAASTVSIYWGTTDGGTTLSAWDGNVAVGAKSAGAFTANLIGLTAATTYYYRCYATNSAGSAWAPTSVSFTTSAPAPVTPTVTNSTGASNITTTAATLNGNLTSDGGAATTVSVYWGAKDGGTTTASWSGNVAVGTKSVGAFTDNITGLTASTTYYYRCYASNSAGSVWAPTSASFSTSAPAPVTPTVTNSTGASNITATAATLNGNLTSDGGAASTVSIYWGAKDGGTTTANWSGNVAVGTKSVGAFTDNITGLTASTTYYYRCYASNSAGSAWAPTSASFTTSAPAPPAVTAPAITDSSGASNIASTSSTLNGNLTSDGGAATTVSVYWGAKDGGTTAASWSGNVALGTKSVGAFTDNITGLTASTTYYYRCYASNSAGSAWAPTSASFSTSAPAPPAVTAPSGLSATTISATQINLAWTDNSNNETGFKIERKTGTGAYAQIATVGANVTTYSNTTGLVANTTYTYRVRAYLGTTLNSAYCNEASATTLPPPPAAPTLLSPASGATNQSLTPMLDWNDVSGAATYGLQVSTVSSFASTLVNQTGLSASTYNVQAGDGLAWNTNYYWRANATNTSGSTSAWSAVRSFRHCSRADLLRHPLI